MMKGGSSVSIMRAASEAAGRRTAQGGAEGAFFRLEADAGDAERDQAPGYGVGEGVGGSERVDRVSPFSKKYVAVLGRWRRALVGGWALLFLAGAYFAMLFMGEVLLVFRPPPGTPSEEAMNILQRYYPNNVHDNDFFILIDTEDRTPLLGNYANETEKFVRALSSGVVEWGKTRSSPPSDFQAVHYFMLEELHAHTSALQLLDNTTSAEDATAMLVVYHMKRGFPQGDQQGSKLANWLDDEIGKLSKQLLSDNVRARPTGMIVYGRDMLEGTEIDMLKMDSLSFPIAMLMLAWMLRSVRLLVIPIINMGLTITVSFMLMYPVAASTDVIAVAPSVMMSVAVAFSVDYSLFLLSRFREERLRSMPVEGSVIVMIESAGHTIMVSGATIMTCWLGLLFFPITLLSTIGLAAGMTVAVTFLINITLTPALLLSFGDFFSSFENFGLQGCWCADRFSGKAGDVDRGALLSDGVHARETEEGPPSPCEFDAFGREQAHHGSTVDPLYGGTSPSPSLDVPGMLRSPTLNEDGSVRGEISSPMFGHLDPAAESAFLDKHSIWFRFGKIVFGSRVRAALSILLVCSLVLPLTPVAVSFHHTEDVKLFAPANAESALVAEDMETLYGPGRIAQYQLVVEPDKQTLVLSNKFFRHVQQVIDHVVLPLDYGGPPALLGTRVQGMMRFNGYNISLTPWGLGEQDLSILGCAVSSADYLLGICASHRCGDALLRCQKEASCSKTLQCIEAAEANPLKVAVCLEQALPWDSTAKELGDCITERCILHPFPNRSETGVYPADADLPDCPSVLLTFVQSIPSVFPRGTVVSMSLDVNPFGSDGGRWLDAIREALEQQSKLDNYSYYLAGGDVAGHDTVDKTFELFPRVLAIILSVVFLLIGVSYRSVLIPLRTVFTLLVTLIIVYGLGVLTFEHGMLEWTHFSGFMNPAKDSLTWLVPALIAPVAIGLGVDYDIFLLTRIFEYRNAGFKTEDSILCGLAQTGGVITAAGVIMFCAFFGLCLSSNASLNQLGFFLVVAVLADTFVVRTILVPSMMTLFREANWWPRVPATLEY